MRFKGEDVYKVTLKHRTESQNAGGQMVEDWDSDDRTIYAERTDGKGMEGEVDGQILSTQVVWWKLRYVDGLNERDYRIEWEGGVYDIIEIKLIGRRKGQLLKTKVRDNEA